MSSEISLLTFGAESAELPASAAAGLEIVNYRPVIAFDDGASDETVMFTGVMPYHAGDDGGFEVWIKFAMASANSFKNIVWTVAWEKLDAIVALASDHFESSLSINPSVNIVAYKPIESVVMFTDAQAGNIDGGDPFRLKVTRGASDEVNDDAAGDAYIMNVFIRDR